MKWYRRTLYAPTSFELAHKVYGWESYEKHTGNIKLEVLPLTYDLREDMFNRVIRVCSYVDETELKRVGNEIEREVARIFKNK